MKTAASKNNSIEMIVSKIDESKNLLLFGSHNSGKTMSAINYALHNNENQKCIYFTSANKISIQGKIAYLQTKHFNPTLNNLVLLQSPIINGNKNTTVDDNYLMKLILGIIQPIEKINPQKIVFDEITPYLGFSDLDLLEKVIKQVFKYLRYYKIKSLFIIGEPVSPRAKIISEILKKEFANHCSLLGSNLS